jgi:hypothetical protein
MPSLFGVHTPEVPSGGASASGGPSVPAGPHVPSARQKLPGQSSSFAQVVSLVPPQAGIVLHCNTKTAIRRLTDEVTGGTLVHGPPHVNPDFAAQQKGCLHRSMPSG